MRPKSSATHFNREAFGMPLGLLGVVIFSLTVPVTKSVVPVFGGWTVGFGRAAIAGLLAAVLLKVTNTPVPGRQFLRPLLAVAGGVVFGFPILTSLALEHLPATRGVIVIGLLPASTALAATLRHGERPSRNFWLAAGGGLLTVTAFAILSGSRGRPEPADALLGLAVIAAALGYAEGAEASKILGGWRTICFALVLSLPITIPSAALAVARHGISDPTIGDVAGLAYLSIFSMLLGFFAWYAALSLGGTAKVSQIQLVQPVLSLGWAWLLLNEEVSNGAILAALGVFVFVGLSRRTSVTTNQSDQQLVADAEN